MAYCRFSDCDVYVYEDVSGGWTTHVAGWRNAAGNAPAIDWTTKETALASFQASNKWNEQNTEYVNIDLPSAGMSFNDASPGTCANRLEALKAEGFDVPQDVIDELREEQAALGEKKDG